MEATSSYVHLMDDISAAVYYSSIFLTPAPNQLQQLSFACVPAALPVLAAAVLSLARTGQGRCLYECT